MAQGPYEVVAEAPTSLTLPTPLSGTVQLRLLDKPSVFVATEVLYIRTPVPLQLPDHPQGLELAVLTSRARFNRSANSGDAIALIWPMRQKARHSSFVQRG